MSDQSIIQDRIILSVGWDEHDGTTIIAEYPAASKYSGALGYGVTVDSAIQDLLDSVRTRFSMKGGTR